MNVLLDTNVVLDTLMQRAPFCAYSNQIFDMAGENKFSAYLVATTLTDIYYLTRKRMSVERTRANMGFLLELFDLLSVGREECALALESHNPDFEDAVLEICTRKSCIDYTITRDQEFLSSCELAISPQDFLTRIAAL